MAANLDPIYPKTAKINWGEAVTAANTAKDGTGAVTTVFTAGADGGKVEKITVRPKGTNVASVLRIFINNGSSNAVAANNVLYEEIGLPTTTLSEVAELTGLERALNLALPAGYKINVTLGTAIAAGVAVTAQGGDY